MAVDYFNVLIELTDMWYLRLALVIPYAIN